MGVRSGFALAVVVAGVAAVTQAGRRAARSQIAVGMQTPAAPSGDACGGIALGGIALGGRAPTAGAPIIEPREREGEIDAAGDELGLAGVAATRAPASVRIRDLRDPAAQFTDQRFLPAAATSIEILGSASDVAVLDEAAPSVERYAW